MVEVAGQEGELCGASINSKRAEVGIAQAEEMFDRFVREIENPGMFIEPMNGPFKIRTG